MRIRETVACKTCGKPVPQTTLVGVTVGVSVANIEATYRCPHCGASHVYTDADIIEEDAA